MLHKLREAGKGSRGKLAKGNEVGISPPRMLSCGEFAPTSIMSYGARLALSVTDRHHYPRGGGDHREKGTRSPVHDLGRPAGDL